MLELYENHYKTRVFPFRNEAYEKTVADRGDQEEIRGIGRLILLWADRDWEKGQIRERFPAVFSAALECLTEIRRELEEQWKTYSHSGRNE